MNEYFCSTENASETEYLRSKETSNIIPNETIMNENIGNENIRYLQFWENNLTIQQSNNLTIQQFNNPTI